VIVRYFKKIKNRIEKLEWLIERVSIDTEYDEDADAGVTSSGAVAQSNFVVFRYDIAS